MNESALPIEIREFFARAEPETLLWYKLKAFNIGEKIGSKDFNVKEAIQVLAPFSIECVWERLSEKDQDKLTEISEKLKDTYGPLSKYIA